MDIAVTVVGSYQANCYAVEVNGSVMIVDPGDDFDAVSRLVDGRRVDAIVITHCHCDHLGVADDLAKTSGAPVIIADEDADAAQDAVLNGFDEEGFPGRGLQTIDRRVVDGDVITVGTSRWHVLVTPGHTPGSMCLWDRDHRVMFTGDTLFAGSIGRTDFIRGHAGDMVSTLSRLALCDDDITVLPGHGPATTIGAERRYGLASR